MGLNWAEEANIEKIELLGFTVSYVRVGRSEAIDREIKHLHISLASIKYFLVADYCIF